MAAVRVPEVKGNGKQKGRHTEKRCAADRTSDGPGADGLRAWQELAMRAGDRRGESNRLGKAAGTRRVGAVTKWGRGAVRGEWTLSRRDRLGELVVAGQAVRNKRVDSADRLQGHKVAGGVCKKQHSDRWGGHSRGPERGMMEVTGVREEVMG